MENVQQDLNYVRSVLDRAEESGGPPSIYWLWAIISLIGFPMYDFRPDLAPIFWPIAGTTGGVLSFVLGWRWGRASGQGSQRIAKYHALHWTGMMVAMGLCVLLVTRGILSGDALPEVILILLTFGWFSAGIYLVRDYLWIGVALGVSLICLLFFEWFGWTGVGLFLATSLAWAGWRGGRKSVSQS